MKLYATITSERASKGQGGNKEIEIILQSGHKSREIKYKIYWRVAGEQTILEVVEPNGSDYLLRMVDELPAPDEIRKRLENLRGEIKAERIGYGEIAELQSLVKYIDAGDVQLLEWAGVEEEKDKQQPRNGPKL